MVKIGTRRAQASRVGKKPIVLPPGVRVLSEDGVIKVEGPKGMLQRELHPFMSLEMRLPEVFVTPVKNFRGGKALWGLTRTLISNMVRGVTEGFEKKLEIEGIGYRAALEGDHLVLHVGFSHPVALKIPEGMSVSVEQNVVRVWGMEKEQVGDFAARIRSVRKVEPYKGKGIRYQGEVVRRKLGKRAGVTGKGLGKE